MGSADLALLGEAMGWVDMSTGGAEGPAEKEGTNCAAFGSRDVWSAEGCEGYAPLACRWGWACDAEETDRMDECRSRGG